METDPTDLVPRSAFNIKAVMKPRSFAAKPCPHPCSRRSPLRVTRVTCQVVMCYHLNGVLQQYDLLKTEDIPSVSGFEPAVVHDIAQNVCSFLRTNCAKEGHTYWL
jgi:hypothetical protein